MNRIMLRHMELFNSKVDHPDYMCDNTPWGIELCKRIDSPNFKLLYDIYHMQISEGDIIRLDAEDTGDGGSLVLRTEDGEVMRFNSDGSDDSGSGSPS